MASLGGLVVAIGGIMTGLLMEGGKVADVKQFTAGLIVLGGTIGAVMVATPLGVLMRAVGQLTEQANPTANLRSPLVLNLKRKLGIQIIHPDSSYSFRQPIQVREEQNPC